jgi:hypothetical protein
MNPDQKLQLKNMIATNKVEDNTDLIRKLKHSATFKLEIARMREIKKAFPTTSDSPSITPASPVFIECVKDCPFMYAYYTDLFNKILKDEVDMNLLDQGIEVLSEIEAGTVDMHEASFKFGTILKKIYVDGAINKADAINAALDSASEPVSTPTQPREISWSAYKSRKSDITTQLKSANIRRYTPK